MTSTPMSMSLPNSKTYSADSTPISFHRDPLTRSSNTPCTTESMTMTMTTTTVMITMISIKVAKKGIDNPSNRIAGRQVSLCLYTFTVLSQLGEPQTSSPLPPVERPESAQGHPAICLTKPPYSHETCGSVSRPPPLSLSHSPWVSPCDDYFPRMSRRGRRLRNSVRWPTVVAGKCARSMRYDGHAYDP